jgi:DNA polymerase elongation subunit (family B)
LVPSRQWQIGCTKFPINLYAGISDISWYEALVAVGQNGNEPGQAKDGDVIIKGGALKSRGLEKFQRVFLEEMIKMIMQGKPEAIADLHQEFERKIRNREWKIDMLMKTDTLQDSLEKYRAKIAGSARNRAAAYELALASGRNYRPGDQISYYIKATPKKVPAYEAAKLASDFDPQNRDENVDYYVAKLDDLMKKFSSLITTASTPKQENLALDS